MTFLLTRKARAKVREITRTAYLTNPDDPQKAIEDAKKTLSEGYGSIISMLLISVAVGLIVKLVTYWVENLITEPTPTYQFGEPGSYSDL